MSKSELSFGLHAVQSLLEHQPESIEVIFFDLRRQDKRLSATLELAKSLGITLQGEERRSLDQRCGGSRHQGVMAQSKAMPTLDEKALWQQLDSLDHPPFLLILDGVTDPHNLGACLRSADASGVDAVIVPKDRAAGLTPIVRKVACGAAEVIPFVQVTNLARTLRGLQEQGIWLVGLAGEAEASLYQADLKGPLAIIMGAEEKGMRRLTREHCDTLVKIPMQGTVESLNVSVATGICLFEALRQRNSQ